MKIGEYTFKRRYSAAQIIVDIFSVGALALLALVITSHIEWAEHLDNLNRTDKVLETDWYPLIVWIVLGILVFAVSFILIIRNKKQPKRYKINEKNAVKYCNIIDTCISCVRLMLLVIIFDLCSSHSYLILFRNFEFPTVSLVSLLIIAGVLVLTKFRLEAVSDSTENERENTKKEIIEN